MEKATLQTENEPVVGLRERQKVTRRKLIVSTMVSLISEVGYESAHMEEIARRSNLSVPTVYRYFKTKRDIVLAAAEGDVQQIMELATSAMECDWDDPCDIFTRVTMSHLRIMLDPVTGELSRQIWKIAYAEAIMSPDDDFSRCYYEMVTSQLKEKYIELSEIAKRRKKLSRFADNEEIATAIMFLAHGVFRLWLLGYTLEKTEAEELVGRQVRLLLRGL